MVKLGVRQETGNSKDNKSFKNCLDVLHKVVGKKCKTKKKKTLVSGNAVDQKNLHPGGRKFIFFNRFSGNILSLFFFIFFCFFCILVFLLFLFCSVVFLKLKIYVLIHIRLCGRVSDKKHFHPADFRKQDHFFWPNRNFLLFC